MIRLIDPTATVPIDIEGTVFHVKQLTNADKLKLHSTFGGLSVNNEGFEEMMNCCADQVVSIDGYDLIDGILQGVPVIDLESVMPGDGLSIREFVQRIDDLRIQRALFAGICDAVKLSLDEEKN